MDKKEFIFPLDEYITELKYQEKALRTLIKYKADIKKFIAFIPDEPTNLQITKDLTMQYKSLICNGKYKTKSINSYIIALNKYLKWLKLPGCTVKVLKTQSKNSLENVVTKADYRRLLRYSQKLGYIDIYYIMRVFASTGIRFSELAFVTVESLKETYITVNNKGKLRDITVPRALCKELKQYCRDKNIKTGSIYTISPVKLWRRLQKIAGFARVSKNRAHAHNLRHMFAKEFMATFNNAIELADILGHSSLETTRMYTRSSNDEKRKKIERMNF